MIGKTAFGRAIVHPSLRLRLTLAFGLAMGVLLAALGVFVYERTSAGLNESLDAGLRARAADVRALVKQTNSGLAEVGRGLRQGGERGVAPAASGFVQVLQPGPSVLEQTANIPRRPLLDGRQRARASEAPVWLTARVPGSIGRARIVAIPVHAQGISMIVVAGASLDEREATLNRLLAVMLLGGPIALLAASLLGFGVATVSLRGVEAMRAKAQRLSLEQPGGRLPVPKAADELRALALTLNEMLERNEAAFLSQQQFVADASHELRSPLSVLKSEIEVALAGSGTASQLRASLLSADAEVDHIIQLAHDLLTLAEAEKGQLKVEATEVRISDLLAHVAARFQLRVGTQRRGLHIDDAAEGLTASVDPLRIEQALSNLLENALRHGAGEITLSARERDEHLELHVTDQGQGFPQGFLDHAFERFSRPDEARTRQGSGLGLSIVRGIARAHGGDAHLANRAAGGADAWIALPRAEPAGATPPPEGSNRQRERPVDLAGTP